MTFTFETELPPRELRPNGGGCSWQKKARLIKKYRLFVAWNAKITCPKDWDKDAPGYTVSLHFLMRTRQHLDLDNAIASFKAGQDGMTDAGVWPDDKCVTPGPVTFGVDRDNPRLVVTVEAMQ